jgi:hypothetical protein
MKLEKTVKYLEAQLPMASPETDAYRSWVDDEDKTWCLWDRYLWHCEIGQFSVNEELKRFLEALEEVNNLQVQLAEEAEDHLKS